MEDFKDKKILIFGLGLNDGGLGMAQFFLDQGALVTITDGKTEEELKSTLEKLSDYKDRIILHLGGHLKEDFLENDIIVRNPAIKPDNEYLQIAKEAGKRIEMEMSLFHRLTPCPIIGITGTRGKSTTTTLIYEFMKKKYGERILLGGNIGKSAIRELPNLTKENIAVLELSSFQLDVMGENKVSPHIAVITNMYKDHQNWHKDMDDYINAKKNICKYQNKENILVANIDNDISKTFIYQHPGVIKTFSLCDDTATYYLSKDLVVYENGKELMSIKESILTGTHNYYNILGAIATVRAYDIEPEVIIDVLKSFNGVSGRQEFIRELKGVKFFNDTTATSVEAMEVMFERFKDEYKGKIIMISGGVDKGLEYEKITDLMKDNLKAIVLLEGTASEKIAQSLSTFSNIYKYYGNFKEAINKAYSEAESGDMIILCPGAASFNMFANEFDRGNKFVDYVNSLE